MLFATYYLWIVPHILLAVFLVCLWRRKLLRQLPIFTAFVIFELILFIVLFGIFLHSPFSGAMYRWVLVIGDGIGSILELGVIYELANELLLSRSSLATVLRPALRGILAVLLLGAAIGSGTLSGISVQRVFNVFEAVDFSSNLIQAGMVLGLFVFARALHVSWRSWVAGIALGFGVSACIDLAGAALRAGFGKSAFIAVDVTDMAAFHVCVVIWLVALFIADRKPSFPDANLKLSDLELWDKELQKMVQHKMVQP
jgi:hypothetical protein